VDRASVLNTNGAAALGSIAASSDTVESEGREAGLNKVLKKSNKKNSPFHSSLSQRKTDSKGPGIKPCKRNGFLINKIQKQFSLIYKKTNNLPFPEKE
jgi:hypothetical protein